MDIMDRRFVYENRISNEISRRVILIHRLTGQRCVVEKSIKTEWRIIYLEAMHVLREQVMEYLYS